MVDINKSLYEHFKAYAQEYGEKRFLFDEERSYTAAEAYREMIAIGNQLHDYGVKAGDLVLYRCTRSVDAYMIYLALQFIGATAVMTDPHQTAEDFLKQAGIEMSPDFILSNEKAEGGLGANGDWELFGHGSLEVCYPARNEEQRFEEVKDVLAPSTIFFTSGSTGKNKGAVINQRALVQRSQDLTSQPWYHEGDIAMITLPIHHGFGLVLVETAFFAGYSLFFPKSNRVEYALECIEKYGVTCMDAVPSYFYAMARANETEKRDVSTLRTGFTGGSPVIAEQHRYIEEVLGMTLHIQYAMSECMSISNTFPSDRFELRNGTFGRIHRGSGCIVDVDGSELPNGQEGEICIFGPAILSEYYGNEEETRRAIDEKGRFHTGDLGFIDEEGCLHISGRLKDIIIRNGLKLVPAKIEKDIRSVAGVEHVVVVGVKDEKLGEAPCALVVLHKGVEMTEEELQEKLLSFMPKNEIPLKILFANEIPLNQIGKPDKKKAKEMFL